MDGKTLQSMWKVNLVTPLNSFFGYVTIHGKFDRRTLSLLNQDYRDYLEDESGPDYPTKGFLRISDAFAIAGGKQIAHYEKFIISKNSIVFAYDEFKRMGDDAEAEQARGAVKPRRIEIISADIAGKISLVVTGDVINFKKKYSEDRFIPMTDVVVNNLSEQKGAEGKETRLPFVAFNRDFIGGYVVL